MVNRRLARSGDFAGFARLLTHQANAGGNIEHSRQKRTGASGPRRHSMKELDSLFGPARPLCGELLRMAPMAMRPDGDEVGRLRPKSLSGKTGQSGGRHNQVIKN